MANNFPIKNTAFLKVAGVLGAGALLQVASGGTATAALMGYALYQYINSNRSQKNLSRLGVAAAASLFTGPIGLIGLGAAAVYGYASYKMDTDKSHHYGQPAEIKLIKTMSGRK